MNKTYLTIEWINNLVKNKINNSVLLLIIDHNYKKEKLIDTIKKELEIIKAKNYEFKELEDVARDTEHIKNIIIIKEQGIDASNIESINCKILSCYYLDLFGYGFTKKESLSELFKVEIKKLDELINIEKPLFYIQKRDPLDILSSENEKVMFEYINSIFWQSSSNKNYCVFNKYSILRYNDSIIRLDIMIFIKHKILTSRLAIIIYKVSTLNFRDSDTKIGLFYKKELKVKSKNMQLPKVKPPQIVKTYNLKGIVQ
ncbi:MAG: hypothetical protein CL623_08160 [Arcobacter sp.]|nr:hypothetical protein [Arcobacter sp.]